MASVLGLMRIETLIGVGRVIVSSRSADTCGGIFVLES